MLDLVVSFGDLVGSAFRLPVVVGRVTFDGVTAEFASGEHTGPGLSHGKRVPGSVGGFRGLVTYP